MIREEIELVHGHGAFSSLAHDALFVAKLLNIKSVFTDHSLFGFADASAIITNRFLEISLSDIDHAICVSHIGLVILHALRPGEMRIHGVSFSRCFLGKSTQFSGVMSKVIMST